MEETTQESAARRRFDTLGLITFLVLLSFVVMLISGAVMFIAPSGRVEKETGWALMGLARAEWQTLHITFAILFIAMGFAHLSCNWRGLLHHLRDRKSRQLTMKREAVIAVSIATVLFASAVLALPPASSLHDLNEFFRRDFWTTMQSENGIEAAPSSKVIESETPASAISKLPPNHPTITDEDSCSDCHRK